MQSKLRPLSIGLALLLAMPLAACQTTAHAPDPHVASDSFWSSVRQERDKVEHEARNKSRGGTIDRPAVVAFLDRGPAHLLSQVPVMPVLDGNDLLGYEIKAFFPASPVFHTIDIEPGDVVTAVNGNRLERPEHLFELYESLRTAPRLQIDVIRSNELRTLTWEIRDTVVTTSDASH